jgi:hypothetical protein
VPTLSAQLGSSKSTPATGQTCVRELPWLPGIRPDVDAYVLNWIVRQPLKRNWFFEERNGNCRLMADLASQLAQTASTWARLVAPLAEWAVKEIAATTRTSHKPTPATRLTQNRKREVRGGNAVLTSKSSVRLQNVCSGCGSPIRNENERCRLCADEVSTERLTQVASEGRVVSHTATAEAKRSKTRLANHAALQEWTASDQPSWLTEKFYAEKVQPLVASLSNSAIARHLGVSRGYANEVRHGRIPHPRHWRVLATLMGESNALQTAHLSAAMKGGWIK